MSPLWPETYYAGLFPGHCWLQRGRKAPPQALQSAPTFDPLALLRALEQMLDEQTKSARKGSRVVITVSDSMATTVPMPWQEALSRPAEIDSYAQICFEKAGMSIDADWVMRAEFRHFGGMGLAYALPRAWLEELLTLTQAKGLRLTAVLPLSAAAYCRQRFRNKKGSTLLLLQEAHRSSAMVYGKEGLLGYDVEPLTRSLDETRLRLLRRVASGYADIARVACWSSDASEPEPSKAIIARCWPDAEAECLQHDAWN